MERRLCQLQARRQASLVWASSYILLGLRYSPALAEQLFRGVVSVKASSTYQAILEEGRMEGRNESALAEAKMMVLLLGEEAFGPADARIERLHNLAELDALLKRIRSAESRQDLLRSSASGSPKMRRR